MNRIVHIGLGNFHRAHQAWWTGAVTDEWTISAYTVRQPGICAALTAQGGRYTLVERGAGGDRFEVVTALSEAVPGTDIDHYLRRVADPHTAVVTMTVTEGGYHLLPDGRVALRSEPIAADLVALAAGEPVHTPPGRLLLGLRARQRADAGPLAVVPCDNVAANGRHLASAILDLADALGDDSLGAWITGQVSFVDTCVDRISPRPTDADRAAVAAATGWADRVPVVTEPFRDWVLSGAFPAGRPPWQDAGARFVDDVAPWERRKLYLLNGAHSLLAYLGPLRGHRTVAEAIGDPVCADHVRTWWTEVGPLVGLDDLAGYCDALLDRFANPAIRHLLAQIAEDGVAKLRVRVAAPALIWRDRGAPAPAAAFTLAAFLAWRGPDVPVATGLAEIAPELAHDNDFVESVRRAQKELT